MSLASGVHRTLIAVRSEVRGRDIVGGQCKYRREWLRTGWENRSNGVWGRGTCAYTEKRLIGRINAHYANSKFPLCVPDTVHVYYDRLWAKVTRVPKESRGYAWGIKATWSQGAPRCEPLISWQGLSFYPGEYWN
jgi:hypothetical protein